MSLVDSIHDIQAKENTERVWKALGLGFERERQRYAKNRRITLLREKSDRRVTFWLGLGVCVSVVATFFACGYLWLHLMK